MEEPAYEELGADTMVVEEPLLSQETAFLQLAA